MSDETLAAIVLTVLLVASHVYMECLNRKRFQQMGNWLVELDQRLQDIERLENLR